MALGFSSNTPIQVKECDVSLTIDNVRMSDVRTAVDRPNATAGLGPVFAIHIAVENMVNKWPVTSKTSQISMETKGKTCDQPIGYGREIM